MESLIATESLTTRVSRLSLVFLVVAQLTMSITINSHKKFFIVIQFLYVLVFHFRIKTRTRLYPFVSGYLSVSVQIGRKVPVSLYRRLWISASEQFQQRLQTLLLRLRAVVCRFAIVSLNSTGTLYSLNI